MTNTVSKKSKLSDKKRYQINIAAIRKAIGMKKTVWFRRHSFKDYPDTTPKWHILHERYATIRDPKATYDWKALCGYTVTYSEYLYRLPKTSRSASGPPKDTVCILCQNIYDNRRNIENVT